VNEPLIGLSSRYPEKSVILGQVFNDTAASYKFFWLLGLLTLLQEERRCVFTQREIIEEMVVAAWHPVCFFRLSLGSQDKLQDAVLELKVEANLDLDAKPHQIRPTLASTVAIRERIRDLTNLVPTRFLSPWFAAELRGIDGHVRTRRIQELATKSQESSSPSPYFFERVASETMIRVNESWAAFFQENFEVVRSFVFFHLCRYLQARNPNVPGIVNKLSAPIMRDLGPARKFWRAVRSEFNHMGMGHLFHDIYSGSPLDDAFSIDHFLPWSFVAHDLLWNLTPVSVFLSTNSRKGDSLPKPELYLPRLSKLHREAVFVMKAKPGMLEDYANWFKKDVTGVLALQEEQFFQHYRESFEPQLQIAHNQGFQTNWSWS
jgi:hypothetical protein